MDDVPECNQEFGSISEIRERLALFHRRRSDDKFLSANQHALQRLLFHSLHTGALYHDAVETLIAVSPFAYRQHDQSVWQQITEDALIGALNVRDGALQAQLLNLLSRYQMLEGKHELARKNIEQALSRAQEEKHELALLWAYIRFFELLVYQPQSFSRHEVINEVLALANRVNHPFSTVTLHYTLGQFYTRWEDYERALGHAQVAYALARRLQEPNSVFRTIYLLVGICRASFCPATRHFHKLTKTVDPARVPLFDQIAAIAQESALYYEMGQTEAAAEGYKDALRLLDNLPRPVHRADYLQGLALAQVRLRQFDDGEANLKRAGEIWEKHGSPRERAYHRYTYGVLEAWRGNTAAALAHLRAAMMLTEEIEQAVSRDHLRELIEEFIQQVESGDLKDEHRLG